MALLVQESRPVVQGIFVLRFWAALAADAPPGEWLRPRVLETALSCLLLSLATYIANGVSDVEEDRRNASSRPLASGRLRPDVAVNAALGCTVAGLVLVAATGSFWLLLNGLLIAAMGWGYSAGPVPFKRHALGTAVSLGAGGFLTYGAAVLAAGRRPDRAHLVILLVLSLWIAVGGATKDLSDLRGDRAAGRRTLPVLLGRRRANVAIAAGAGCMTVGAAVAALLWPVDALSAGALVVGGAAVVVRSLRGPGSTARRDQRAPYTLFMLTQYAANAGLLLTCVALLGAVHRVA